MIRSATVDPVGDGGRIDDHSPAGAGWSAWLAPAKLNLFLQITGRRADGYHLLQTVFQLLDWGDRIWLRRRADDRIERTAGPAGVPANEDLAVRAARLLQQEARRPVGADIRVDKRIPLGGGFGGGSSDAATVLVALNRLWATGFDEQHLAELGSRLGADVPVFVRGRSAWAEGVGERLTPLALAPRWYLLLDSGVHVPTGELFQASELTRNAIPLKMPGPNFDALVGNAFEPVVRARAPRIDAALTALSRFGQARLTGTGGGCFIAFERREDAQAACAALDDEWPVWIARGVDESPLRTSVRASIA